MKERNQDQTKRVLKRERSDSRKNTAKVLKVILKDPTASEREVAQATGLSNGTAHNKLSSLEHLPKSDFIEQVLGNDREIILRGQKIINDKLSDEKYIRRSNAKDISQITKDSTARYSLFKGDITDAEGGLKDFRSMSDQELEDYIFSQKKGPR